MVALYIELDEPVALEFVKELNQLVVLDELAERYNESLNPATSEKSPTNKRESAAPLTNHISSTTEPSFGAEEGLVRQRVTKWGP